MTFSWLAGLPALGTVALAILFYAPDKRRDALEAAYPGDYRIVDGVRLRLRDTGPHDAPAVILLPGSAPAALSFEGMPQKRLVEMDAR